MVKLYCIDNYWDLRSRQLRLEIQIWRLLSNEAPAINLHFNKPLKQSYDLQRREIVQQMVLHQDVRRNTLYLSGSPVLGFFPSTVSGWGSRVQHFLVKIHIQVVGINTSFLIPLQQNVGGQVKASKKQARLYQICMLCSPEMYISSISCVNVRSSSRRERGVGLNMKPGARSLAL